MGARFGKAATAKCSGICHRPDPLPCPLVDRLDFAGPIAVSWLRCVREFGRELRDVSAVLALPRERRPLVVYSEGPASQSAVQGYLDALRERHGRHAVYVTSAPDDPLLHEDASHSGGHYMRSLLPYFMRRLDSRLLLTTIPDLGKLGVPRPQVSCHCAYAFHSLNSIHEVYLEGAFDHYDSFLCAGPHHKRELETHFRTYGLPQPTLHEVGYYQLDRVHRRFEAHVTGSDTCGSTVVVAPSWGRGNLLELAGHEIVGQLLAVGCRVIVRPHPCFFLPIYQNGRQVIDRLEARWNTNPMFRLERDVSSIDSFLDADLMISDFSGAAFEYALGTLRPVLFIDAHRKTRNPNWRRLGLPTLEDTIRPHVGRVLGADDIGHCGAAAEALLASKGEFRDRLQLLREKVIYNVGRSAEVGADVLEELLSRRGPT